MPNEQEQAGRHPLRAKIMADIEATRSWAQKQRRIEERRHGVRQRRKIKPYRGAPNFVDPIIDDNVTEKTDQEISMLWNAPRIVHALSLDDIEMEQRTMIESALDTYVRHIIKLRAPLEYGLDMKNSRGFTVVKNVRKWNEILKQEIPDLLFLENLRCIVPPDTIVGLEERITHIFQLTPRELRLRKKQKKWKNVDEVIAQAKQLAKDADDNESHRTIHETLRSITGIDESDHDEFITIAEVYHYADDDDEGDFDNLTRVMNRVRNDDKVVTIFPLHFPHLKLAQFPWRNPDRLEEIPDEEYEQILVAKQQQAAAEERVVAIPPKVRQIVGEEKPWPFTPLRFEEKSPFWYEARGGGHKLMDDQIEATQLKNMRATLRDFYMNPLLKSTGKGMGRNPSNVTYEPGSALPEGYEWQEIPSVPQDISLGQNEVRATAGRRMGNVGQSNFSQQIGRRKLQKTATEITSENAQQVTISTASVDRFNEPLSRPMQIMWEDIKRMRVIMPIIMPNGQFLKLDPAIFESNVLLIPAASSKTLNPDLQLVKAIEVANFATSFIQFGVPVDAQGIFEWVLSNYDPAIAMQFMSSPNENGPQGQPPVYTVLDQIQRQLQEIGEAGSQVFEMVTALQKLAVENSERIESIESREMKDRAEPAQT